MKCHCSKGPCGLFYIISAYMISWGWVDERRFGGKGVSGPEGDLWRGTVGTIWLEPICSGLVCLSSPMWEGCMFKLCHVKC